MYVIVRFLKIGKRERLKNEVESKKENSAQTSPLCALIFN